MFKRKKKKTGVQTPKLRKPTPPPPPPTSRSNAVKPNPNYVPPASNPHPYNPPPMPKVAPAKEKYVEDFHRVNLYLTVEDLNDYIHKALKGKGKYALNTYVPISATVNDQNLNIEINCVAINPKDSDYGRRIRLEVKL